MKCSRKEETESFTSPKEEAVEISGCGQEISEIKCGERKIRMQYNNEKGSFMEALIHYFTASNPEDESGPPEQGWKE